MGLRCLSEYRKREVARYWFARPACRSAASRCSHPLRACGVGVHFRRPTHAPLGDLRAPTGHLPRNHRRHGAEASDFRRTTHHPEADSPSWASVPYSACRSRGPLYAGLPHPPRSGLSVSHALAGLRPPNPSRAYFIPVTLLGFDLQGFSLPKSRTSLEAVPLMPFDPARTRRHEPNRGFRGLLPPGVRTE